MKRKWLYQFLSPNRQIVPYLVLFSTLLLSAIATYYVESTARNQERLRFDSSIQRTENLIRDHVKTYIALLRAGSGLFAAQEDVDRDEFRAYMERLQLREEYPGIQGIGFTIRLSPSEKDQLINRMQEEGLSNFAIHPDYPRPEYHAIIYLEPLDQRNRAAIGYDMFSEPVRRQAMERARDSGLPAASGRVILRQEIDQEKQAGFLIYFPIYQGNSIPQTVIERRQKLIGFIYSPFRMGDLMQGLFGSNPELFIDFKIYDGLAVTPAHLLYNSNPESPVGFKPGFQRRELIDIAGHTWTIEYTSRPELDFNSQQVIAPYIALSGGLVSIILFGLMRSQIQARRTAEKNAMELRKSEKALRDLEAQLRTRAEELAEANRLKDEFLATLSHELRTPLNAMLGWTQLLMSRQLDEEIFKRATETINRNTRALAQMIEDLLDVSRVITGKLHLSLNPTSLIPIIEAAIDTVRPATQAKNITIHTALEPNIGIVMADGNRLQQVIWNLLTNAVKFSSEGGKIEVRLSKSQDKDQVSNLDSFSSEKPDFSEREAEKNESVKYAEIHVSDTGQGISQDFLPFVFERFRQADGSITRKQGGLGLGLAIVRHLVELHGGTVSVDSPGLGQGTTFTVTLPLMASDLLDGNDDFENFLNDHNLIAESCFKLKGIRILVVDDEVDARDFVAHILQNCGAEVVTVGSAEEALNTFNVNSTTSPFQILVSDIGMPGGDGYSLLRQIRLLPPEVGGKIPALALTAYAKAEDRQEAFKAGFHAHLAKPVESYELLFTIANLIGIIG